MNHRLGIRLFFSLVGVEDVGRRRELNGPMVNRRREGYEFAIVNDLILLDRSSEMCDNSR